MHGTGTRRLSTAETTANATSMRGNEILYNYALKSRGCVLVGELLQMQPTPEETYVGLHTK